MNILIDGRVFSRNAAGVTTFLKCALMEWARQRNLDTFYVVLPKGLDKSIELPELPSNVTFLDYSRKFNRRIPNIIVLQLLMPYLCRKLHIDLYYAPVPHIPRFLPSKVRTFITIHDVVNIEMKDTMSLTNRLSSSYFFGQAVKQADFLWCNSHYTKSKVNQYFPDRRCKEIVVGDAVDSQLFYPQHLSEEQKKEIRIKFGIKHRFILFVGSLEPRKNLEFLLRIIPKLYREQGIQLVVVGGKGWKNSSLKATVEAPDFPKESTIFCGYVTNFELASLYNTADSFVSASLMEGFGMPQLEALECGCPIVTADNTAMTEVARNKDGAFLVSGYEPETWQKVIRDVIEKKPTVNRQQLAEYDWRLIVRQLTDMITKKQTI